MPQKSTYLQGPYTLNDLVQTVKDGFATVGTDTAQTTDDSLVFDSDYWISKYVQSNPSNLFKESELLLSNENDYNGNAGRSNFFASGFNKGSEAYINQNSDSALPFKFSNYIRPRAGETDNYICIPAYGLSTSQDYTFSFYAKKHANTSSTAFTVSRTDRGNSNNRVESKYALTTDWQRFSTTIRPSNSEMDFNFGGWSNWGGGSNYIPYSEYLYPWSYSGIGIEFHNQETPFSRYDNKGSRLYSAGSSGIIYITSQTGSQLKGKTFTFSVYAKVISGSPKLSMSDTAGEGSNSSGGSTTPMSNTGVWKRYTNTFTFTNSTSTRINTHIEFSAGDEMIFWGAQLNEGTTPDVYFNTYGNQSVGSPFIGSVEIAGIQLEVGSSATSYKPNNSWCYKPNETIIDTKLQNEVIGLTNFIPPGTLSMMYNVEGLYNSDEFYGGFSGTSSTYSMRTYSAGTPRGLSNIVYPLAYNSRTSQGSYGTFVNDYLTYYASDFLRVPTRNYNHNAGEGLPFGSIIHTFAPYYVNPSASVNVRVKIKGTFFKLTNDAASHGYSTGKMRSIVLNHKTPGNGKRKQLSYLFYEGDNNQITVLSLPRAIQFPKTGTTNAEAPGPFIPTVTGKKSFNFSGKSYTANYYMGDVFKTSLSELVESVVISKNNDLFNFVQGSSEGFIHAMNVSSAFVFYVGYFDFVNSPIAEDDGSVATRTCTLYDARTSDPGWFLMSNGVNFDNYYINTTPFFKNYTDRNIDSNLITIPYEIYGDTVTKDNSIFPVYAGQDSIGAVSNRGHVKNLYITQNSAFSGNVGDIFISKDNSRYFCFSKKDIYNRGTYSLFVKV